MLLRVRKYLFDIHKACQLLQEFTEGKSFDDYQNDAMLRSAVERQFEIVGEAMNQMLRLDSSLAQKITDSKRIISFRNVLIHGYASVSNEIVWGIVESYLPRLNLEIIQLLQEENENM